MHKGIGFRRAQPRTASGNWIEEETDRGWGARNFFGMDFAYGTPGVKTFYQMSEPSQWDGTRLAWRWSTSFKIGLVDFTARFGIAPSFVSPINYMQVQIADIFGAHLDATWDCGYRLAFPSGGNTQLFNLIFFNTTGSFRPTVSPILYWQAVEYQFEP